MSGQLDEIGRIIEGVAAAADAVKTPEDHGLALVARECGFEDRYRVWRGRSGRRYLVTVMPISEAMRVDDGVVLLVAIDEAGGREIVWAGESGSTLPGLALSPSVRLEAHVHLLAAGRTRRAAALADLISGTEGYSSVLTLSAAATQARVGSVTPRRSSSRAVFST